MASSTIGGPSLGGMQHAIAVRTWDEGRLETDKAPQPLGLVPDREQEFISAHLRRVFLLIYRMVGNAADAQDLTQEAFVKALSRRDQLKDEQKAAQWLGRIAYHTAIDYLRQRRKMSYCELEAAPEPQHHESPERLVLRAEKQAYLADGLRLLSERERAALVLRDVEGLPAADVARHIGCSPATVRSHIANARAKFRKYIRGRKA
jgi:RNA polymerase sigma-70 factor (ECF subfamily)